MLELLQNLKTLRVCILVSGSGTNMQNLVQILHHKILNVSDFTLHDNKSIESHIKSFNYSFHSIKQNNISKIDFLRSLKIDIVEVISNVKSAAAIEKAHNLGIKTSIIDNKDFKNRLDFDMALARKLKSLNVDYILLAGFMRILSEEFLDSLKDIKILNIHPSFLPLHKGENAIEKSFKDDNNFGGVSVHFVEKDVDSGKIILQEKLPKLQHETLEDFALRVHELEYKLYPMAFLKVIKESYESS